MLCFWLLGWALFILKQILSYRGKCNKPSILLISLLRSGNLPLLSSPWQKSKDTWYNRKINAVEGQHRNATTKGPVRIGRYFTRKVKVLTHLRRSKLTGKIPQGRDLQPKILLEQQSALKYGLREVQPGSTAPGHTAELPSLVLPCLTACLRWSIRGSGHGSTVPIQPRFLRKVEMKVGYTTTLHVETHPLLYFDSSDSCQRVEAFKTDDRWTWCFVLWMKICCRNKLFNC